MMLHNEARELAVKAVNGKHSMKEVAEMFGACPSTLYLLKKKMKKQAITPYQMIIGGKHEERQSSQISELL